MSTAPITDEGLLEVEARTAELPDDEERGAPLTRGELRALVARLRQAQRERDDAVMVSMQFCDLLVGDESYKKGRADERVTLSTELAAMTARAESAEAALEFAARWYQGPTRQDGNGGLA